MKISIASDHAGFEQKEHLASYLRERGYEIINRGPDSADRVDYPDYALAVALDVVNGKSAFGVLLCGTGIGMSISANKVDGIRAANVTTPEFAELARAHNNANIVCLSARFVDEETNRAIVETFLGTDFEGGRHACRVQKISDIELLPKE